MERLEYGYHSAISKEQTATKWVQVDLGVTRDLTEVILTGCHDTYNNLVCRLLLEKKNKI